MDPTRFDSSVGDVFVASASGDVAFVVRFGREASEPATPVFDVVVHCTHIRTAASHCSETKLEDLRRAHPGLTDRAILEQLVARR